MEALIGATIYPDPGSAFIPDGVVLIDPPNIAAVGPRAAVAIPPGTKITDCPGMTVTAGFWNSHVHFFERKWANGGDIPPSELALQLRETFTRYGFTSVFDLSSPWDNTRRIRDRIESGEVPGPRIRSTGQGLVPPNPGITDAMLASMGVVKTELPEVGNEEQAAAAARKLLDAGVDAIKIFVSAPSKAVLPETVMAAAVAEAQRAHKPVFVHPNTAADIAGAVRAGAGIIGHTTPMSGPWDQALIDAMRQHRVALTPTLTLWRFYLRHDRISIQQKTVDTAVAQLRAWVEAGGEVLFGTDLGAVESDPAEELRLMSQAGMTFRQMLASLTTAPATRFGEGKRLGRVAPGFLADLAVLKDTQSLSVVRTYKGGQPILAATREP